MSDLMLALYGLCGVALVAAIVWVTRRANYLWTNVSRPDAEELYSNRNAMILAVLAMALFIGYVVLTS